MSFVLETFPLPDSRDELLDALRPEVLALAWLAEMTARERGLEPDYDLTFQEEQTREWDRLNAELLTTTDEQLDLEKLYGDYGRNLLLMAIRIGPIPEIAERIRYLPAE